MSYGQNLFGFYLRIGEVSLLDDWRDNTAVYRYLGLIKNVQLLDELRPGEWATVLRALDRRGEALNIFVLKGCSFKRFSAQVPTFDFDYLAIDYLHKRIKLEAVHFDVLPGFYLTASLDECLSKVPRLAFYDMVTGNKGNMAKDIIDKWASKLAKMRDDAEASGIEPIHSNTGDIDPERVLLQAPDYDKILSQARENRMNR